MIYLAIIGFGILGFMIIDLVMSWDKKNSNESNHDEKEVMELDLHRIDYLIGLIYDDIEFNFERIRVYSKDYPKTKQLNELVSLIDQTNRQNYQTIQILRDIKNKLNKLGSYPKHTEDMIEELISRREKELGYN